MKLSLANHLTIKYALSGSLEVWHCGRDLKGGSFSLEFLGSGEGMLYLGPGIYFTDNENLARRYAKYHDKAFLYKCSLPVDGLYDPSRGTQQFNVKMKELCTNLAEQFQLKDWTYTYPKNSFKNGKSIIGFLVEKFGRSKAVQMLAEIGINGIYENLPNGALEICVYDLSIIKVISKEAIQYEKDPWDK